MGLWPPRWFSRELNDGAAVNIDPHEMNEEELKLELDRELSEFAQEDLNLVDALPPQRPSADEHGRIPGRIINVRGSDVYVDIGGKSEAFLSLSEFPEDQPPQPGQLHTFIMQGLDKESGLTRLSLRQAKLEAELESLQVGDVIEARVTGVNLGGLELLAKNTRAFMPKSHVDLERVEDFTPYIGRKLECQITELDRRGRSMVVSRRKVLEKQREELRQELKYSLAEGQTRHGVVRRITDFGAFVDLGGVDGLLHIGDMSYSRVKSPNDVLKVGDEVEVLILKIDLVKDRISLGMKQLAPDPWNVVEANYRVGATVDGKVVKLMEFGAFVELQPGVEGLIPISEISWTQRIRHPKDVLNEGDSVRVAVLSVDAQKRKISLSLKALGQDPWSNIEERYQVDAIVSGAVTRLTGFGAFVQLEEGIEGLLHVSEMSDKHVSRPDSVVKPGDVIKVRIKGIEKDQRRISLSMRSLAGPEAPAADIHAATQSPKKKRKPLKGGLDR